MKPRMDRSDGLGLLDWTRTDLLEPRRRNTNEIEILNPTLKEKQKWNSRNLPALLVACLIRPVSTSYSARRAVSRLSRYLSVGAEAEPEPDRARGWRRASRTGVAHGEKS